MSLPKIARPRLRLDGVLLAVLALAATVRIAVIDRDALWLDEGYSWWDAHQPLRALWTLVPTCDPHPPLYFLLLHGWLALFGDSTVAMRALSLVFGLATIVVVWLCGRELDRARGREADRLGIGAFAALLFALTPFQAYFSVEARPYALLCFGAALLTWGCLAVVRAGRSVEHRLAFAWVDRVGAGAWLALLIGGAIVVWTNNTAVLVLGAASIGFIALWAFDRDSRATIVPVVVAGAAIGIVWAPDWPLLIEQSREVTGDFWIQKPSFEGLTFELHNLIGLDVLRSTWWIVLAVVGGLLAIGRVIGWRWTIVVGALAIMPIALNVAISYLLSPILLSRAMIGAAPALAIALAAGVVLIRSRSLRFAAAVALVAAHAISLERYVTTDHVKEPWKPVVARLAAEAGRGPLLVVPNELVLPILHEAKMQDVTLNVRGLPADYPAIGLKGRYPSGKCAPSIVDRDLTPMIDSLRGEQAVVLLTRLHNTYDPDEAIAAALRQAGYALRHDDVFQPGDLRIMHFTRDADRP